MAKKKDMTYAEALEELEAILGELESGDADVDTLGSKVKRAGELIAFCRGRLRESEMEVTKALTGLEKDAVEDETEPEEEKPKAKGSKDGQKGESLF